MPRRLAVDVRRIREGAAAEHDDDVALGLRGRRVGVFERTHEHVGDEIRREEVEDCGDEHDRLRREALAPLPRQIGDEEEGEEKDAGRQEEARTEFQKLDHRRISFPGKEDSGKNPRIKAVG